MLIGPPALTRVVAGYLPASRFTRLGEVFAPGEVDLGPDRDELGGLGAPGHGRFATCTRRCSWRGSGPAALRCRCCSGRRSTSRSCSRRCCATRRRWSSPACRSPATSRATGGSWRSPASRGAHGRRCPRARFAASRRSGRRGRGGPTACWWRAAGSTGSAGTSSTRCRTVRSLQRSACIELPWTLGGGHLDARAAPPALRGLARGLSRFAAQHWFRGLSQGLRRAWDERLETRRRPAPRAAARARGAHRRPEARRRSAREPAPGASGAAPRRCRCRRTPRDREALRRSWAWCRAFVALESRDRRAGRQLELVQDRREPDRAARHPARHLPAQRAGAGCPPSSPITAGSGSGISW